MRRARISSGGVRSSSLFLATGRDGCVATRDVYYGVTPDAIQRRCICTRHACHHSYRGSRVGRVRQRFDPRQVERLKGRCPRLARFVADTIETLEASDPKLPECAFNRLADNCRPLFASAEILLADLKQKFTDDRIFSKRIWSNCWHK